MKALIIDDDLALADVLSFTLRRAGYQVVVANDGLLALERWRTEAPDFIILDLNLPRLSGLEVCQRIRKESDIPILILSVRDEDDDVVAALGYGADDYMTKPFSPRQLVARVEAVLRRSGSERPVSEQLTAGDLILDSQRGVIFVEQQLPVHLTPLENRLMQTLMINQNQVMPAQNLIDHVWGPAGGDRAMLKQLVYRLRAKIASVSTRTQIENLPGVGYCLSIK